MNDLPIFTQSQLGDYGEFLGEYVTRNGCDIADLLNMDLPGALQAGVLKSAVGEGKEEFAPAHETVQELLSGSELVRWEADTLSQLGQKQSQVALEEIVALPAYAERDGVINNAFRNAFYHWSSSSRPPYRAFR